ncbi:hypothetical protein DXV75_16605 [Alteromonas aestuariivivens]|uniref:Sulfurtransferase complex subunit TusB n=1 Tax=Alteromonas aestuariivivens TaxID=1938339 RepID=A0A3D8M2J7_9ALTE|nr:hypothetical protein [Alteromonas aestuariivivens]RDV23923.1 hypothetical protein DXV75_16605 [Alteromonas aestuariivivens]
MLFIHSQSHITHQQRKLLSAAPKGTPLVLTENGVYLFALIFTDFANLDIFVLEQDALSRGVKVADDNCINALKWAALSHSHAPWVTL